MPLAIELTSWWKIVSLELRSWWQIIERVGPSVARSDVVPWAPRLENDKRGSPTRVEHTAARVWPKLVSCKSLSECCEARPGRRPERAPARVGGGLVLELRGCQGEQPDPS